jgi:TonB family protein
MLDDAAVEAVKQWTYEPATKDGVPVKIWMPVSMSFQRSR